MKTKVVLFVLFLFVVLILLSCAGVTNIEACRDFEPYGFWGGLWHGFISPISFIGSLFNKDIAMYAVNNNGGWYDFGFVWGTGIVFGASVKSV